MTGGEIQQKRLAQTASLFVIIELTLSQQNRFNRIQYFK